MESHVSRKTSETWGTRHRLAYAEPVLNLFSPSRSTVTVKLGLPVLLLLLLLTQAASTVCGAQCVQHQLPHPSNHAMAHCHSMLQPEESGATPQTCPAATHAVCAIDLLANTQAKTAPRLTLHADARPEALLPHRIFPTPKPSPTSNESSTDSAPLITALRV